MMKDIIEVNGEKFMNVVKDHPETTPESTMVTSEISRQIREAEFAIKNGVRIEEFEENDLQ